MGTALHPNTNIYSTIAAYLSNQKFSRRSYQFLRLKPNTDSDIEYDKFFNYVGYCSTRPFQQRRSLFYLPLTWSSQLMMKLHIQEIQKFDCVSCDKYTSAFETYICFLSSVRYSCKAHAVPLGKSLSSISRPYAWSY